MTIRTFEKLLLDAQKQGVLTNKGKSSLVWLSSESRRIPTDASKIIREADKNELVNANQMTMGKMYMFFYDSKLYKEDKLPYFDRTPVIFPVDTAPGGFYGINFHYLPYGLRAKLMDTLYEIENNAKFNKNKKLKLSYGVLKSTGNLWKPCLKRYLYTHCRSRFFKIGYESWNIAAFLPIATFEGATQSKVWADSKEKLKND